MNYQGWRIDGCSLEDLVKLFVRDRTHPRGWNVVVWTGESVDLYGYPDELEEEVGRGLLEELRQSQTRLFIFHNGDLVEQKG